MRARSPGAGKQDLVNLAHYEQALASEDLGVYIRFSDLPENVGYSLFAWNGL